MVALITQINGVALALFHMEQFFPGTFPAWHWRWRIVGDHPEEYLGWREGVATGRRVLAFPEIAGCAVEAQWRPAPEAAWCQAPLHVAAPGSCRFLVTAREGHSADFRTGFTGYAAVADLVACYEFPPLALPPRQSAEVEATCAGFLDNVLLAEAEFVAMDPALQITNLGPSVGTLLPVSGAARLRLAEGAAQRQVYALRSSAVVVPPPPAPAPSDESDPSDPSDTPDPPPTPE